MAISAKSDNEGDGIPFVEDALSESDAEASVTDAHESPAESLGMAPDGISGKESAEDWIGDRGEPRDWRDAPDAEVW